MRKNIFVFLFVVFFSLASFAETPPNLWAVEYGPELNKMEGNSLDGHEWLREVDKVRPNASAISSKEIAFSIEGISHTFVREHAVEGIAGSSVVGYVGNSPFQSVITTDKEGRVVANVWVNQGGRAKNFKVIRNILFESDNMTLTKKLDNDYLPKVGAGKFKVQTNGKRRAVGVCGEPYWLETTGYLYEQSAVDSWLFQGDEAALRLYLQNTAEGLNPTLRNSKIYDVVVRLTKLEKVPDVPNAPTTQDLFAWLFEKDPHARSLLNSGINTVALWYGVNRPDAVGRAGDNVRVNLIGGGSQVENHEWGHNHHARHQPEDYPGVTVDEYPTAFANAVNTQFATAVAVPNRCPNFCDVIPVYSSPNVTYNGIPTGTVDRNNAGVIRQGAIDLGAVPKCGAGGIGSGGNSVFETNPEN